MSRGALRWVLVVSAAQVLLAATLLAGTAQALQFANGLESWGANSTGQLGDGTTSDSHVDVGVSTLSNVQEVSAGSDFTLALMKGGTVMAWGDNSEGQLGDGSTTSSDVPVQVSGLSLVKAISAGGAFGLALLRNGTVMAWGDDSNGQLGPSGTVGSHSDVPVPVTGLPSGVSDVQAGGAFALAIVPYGTVMAWGANSEGQLGDGTTTDSSTPEDVQGLTNDTRGIQAGSDFAFAVLGPETVESWGDDSVGQLGDGSISTCSTAPYSDTPVSVKGLTFVRAVSAGQAGAVAVTAGGVVSAWGDNSQGELGPETSATCSGVPQTVPGLSKVVTVSSGSYFNLALLHDGLVEAWGSNSNGQLGNGSTVNSSSPVQVEDLSGVQGISAGSAFAVVKVKNQPPTLPRNGHATASVGSAFSLTIKTSSHPTISSFSILSGSLPVGLSFTDNHNDTATIAGTPAAGSANTYRFAVEASNGVPASSPRLAVENFRLVVKG
jgi:alpha-tubulin suppressor-like RCC1 family protein